MEKQRSGFCMILLAGAILMIGCGRVSSHITVNDGIEEGAAETERAEGRNSSKPDSPESGNPGQTSEVGQVTQGGPYGSISLTIPEGWNYSLCEAEEALEILDSLVFDENDQSGCIGYYGDEQYVETIGLEIAAQKVTPQSAVILFYRMETDSVTEVSFGGDFVLERKGTNGWEDVEIICPENYSISDIAYLIPVEEALEYEFNWEVLYGSLEAGDYRIGLTVMAQDASGNYKSYRPYASFLVR